MNTHRFHCGSRVITNVSNVLGNHFCILLLNTNASFFINGKAKLIHLSGPPVQIMGASVRSNIHHQYDLFSPKSHAPITLRQQPHEDQFPVLKDGLTSALTHVLSRSVDPSLVSEIAWQEVQASDSTPSILLFEPLECRISNSLSNVKKFRDLFDLCDANYSSFDPKSIESLGFAFTPCDASQGFRISTPMLTVASSFSDFPGVGGGLLSPRLLVAGPKGAGKSSLLRFIINYNLTMTTFSNGVEPCVALFDCDIGQPEFTPSGLVSLTLIKSPLFGPPFVHQILARPKPIRQCFVGSVTPSDNPEFYLKCLAYVFEAYEALPQPRPPLMINTMGWTQGLGLTFLLEQILLTKPDIVAQIQLNPKQPGARQNLPILDTATIRGMQGWNLQDLSNETFHHRVLVVPCISSSSPQGTRTPARQFGAPDHRDLSTMAHFTTTLAQAPTSLPARRITDPLGHPVAHFLDCLPYKVPIICQPTETADPKDTGSHLSVCLMQSKQSLFPNATSRTIPWTVENVLACLNASLVALCSVPIDQIKKSEDPRLCERITPNPVCECIGLAICRAVDIPRGLVYLTTGIPPEDLVKVNAILRGSVNLPQCFFLEQKFEHQRMLCFHIRVPRRHKVSVEWHSPRVVRIRGRHATNFTELVRLDIKTDDDLQ